MATNHNTKVILKIKNQVPQIELETDNGEQQRMITSEQGIDTLVMKAAEEVEKDIKLPDIFAELKEGDELFMHFTELDRPEDKIDFSPFIDEVRSAVVKYKDKEPGMEGDKQVIEQIREYWQLDVLASFVDCVYDELVARTVVAASNVGTGQIILQDEREETLLREKMEKELNALDISLEVRA